MRLPFERLALGTIVLIGAGLLIGACQDDPAELNPVAPRLAGGPNAGCDVKDATRAARDYFTDNGRGSFQARALDELDVAEAACDADDSAAYVASFFAMAGLIEGGMAAGATGDPADGNTLLQELLGLTTGSGELIFDACNGAAGCTNWEGFPTLPDFTSALSSADGAFAVPDPTSADVVCSGHAHPCSGVDPDPLEDGDTWGVFPPSSWAASTGEVLIYGAPSSGGSPTAEALLAAGIPVYDWFLIPNRSPFPMDEELVVGLCSEASAAVAEGLIQRGTGGTILEEAGLPWCGNHMTLGGSESFLGRLASAIGSLLNPVPQPLVATVALSSPGGSAGGFTTFYAVDVPINAALEWLNPPVDGRVGQPLVGADGKPVKVLAKTTTGSPFTPLEQVALQVRVKDNNGLVPSGGEFAGPTCSNSVCTGITRGDELGMPGTFEFPGINLTKTGGYRMCVRGTLAPFVFGEVCTGLFNVRPVK